MSSSYTSVSFSNRYNITRDEGQKKIIIDFEMQACYEMGSCEQTYVMLQQTEFDIKTCTHNEGFLNSCKKLSSG